MKSEGGRNSSGSSSSIWRRNISRRLSFGENKPYVLSGSSASASFSSICFGELPLNMVNFKKAAPEGS